MRQHLGVVAYACTTAAIVGTGRLYLFLPVLLASLAWVAATEPVRVSLPVLAVAVLTPVAFVDTIDRAVLLAMIAGLTWCAAAGLRWRRAQAEREALSRLEVETYRAVTEERLRIARDLHDLVAHGLTAMTVQAAYGALTSGDDSRVTFRAIEESGRETLGQVRQLLRVLRSDPAPLSPAPRLSDLEALVTATERAGLPVEINVTVPDSAVSAAAAGCVYHVVREGITNALKHSQAPHVRVSVDRLADQLVVAVTNPRATTHPRPHHPHRAGHVPKGPPGLGLIGLRERVEAYGGELTAGTDDQGGYRLEARLPTPHNPEPA